MIGLLQGVSAENVTQNVAVSERAVEYTILGCSEGIGGKTYIGAMLCPRIATTHGYFRHGRTTFNPTATLCKMEWSTLHLSTNVISYVTRGGVRDSSKSRPLRTTHLYCCTTLGVCTQNYCPYFCLSARRSIVNHPVFRNFDLSYKYAIFSSATDLVLSPDATLL